MVYELKIFPEDFDVVRSGEKTFELRQNDRNFRVGDYLSLNEWDGESYTGRTELALVTYILNLNDLMTCAGGYVVMSFVRCGSFDS